MKIAKALHDYFVPQRNVLYERFIFNTTKQKPGETIDPFSMRLRQLAVSCEFGQIEDELIRDRIVIGTTDAGSRERLLRERPVPDVNRVIENLRAAEISRAHRDAMNSETPKETEVQHRHSKDKKGKSQAHGRNFRKPTQSRQNKQAESEKTPKCNYCGREKHPRQPCPAKNSTCTKCKNKGHWATACRSKATHEIKQIPTCTTYDYLNECNEIVEETTSSYLGEVVVINY